MPDPELSERLWGKEWASGIRSTICPEANSNVKCETRIFGDYDRRSRRRSPLLFFPTASNSRTQWTGHGGERVPHQSEGRQFAHYRRVFQRRARVTIIVIIVSERTRLRRTASIQSRSMLQLEPHKPRLTRASLSFYSSIVEELISALCVVSRRLACMNFRFLSFPLKRISKHRNKKVNKETSHVLQHIDFADP
jgi:hypothetical protein